MLSERLGSTSHAALVGGLSALRLVVSLATLGVGFRAVSDDDYARVVIAEQFARSPHLDPSGTSWLPLPFWLNGTAMMALGRSLEVAMAMALLAGLVSTALTYVAAIWLTRDRTAAVLGAALTMVMPWGARLGVSTVPELPTAALTLLGMAAVATPLQHPARARRLLLGGLALLAATLSRYEPWFVAIGFALIVSVDALRGQSPPTRARSLAIAILALAGPTAWIAWNRHAHGSPLHFLDRVSAYRDAIDHGSLVARIGGYLFALARAEPEMLALVVAALVHLASTGKGRLRETLAPFERPFLLSGFLLFTLTASSIRGGAPTHHPERALFVLFLLLPLVLGRVIAGHMRDRERAPKKGSLALLLLGIAALSFPTRRWVLQSESFADRSAEVEIGRAFAHEAREGEVALLEVVDYGFFAVQAASGRPEDLVADRKIDPGHPAPPLALSDLVDRARHGGYSRLVARRAETLPEGARIVAEGGGFMIVDVGRIR